MSIARREIPRWVFAAGMWWAVAALAGCASNIGERIPTAVGGLPENAPKRSETPPAYPSVHEMPPKRSGAVLSGAEQKRLEDELAAERAKAASGTRGQ
jgi:hypothetical protein